MKKHLLDDVVIKKGWSIRDEVDRYDLIINNKEIDWCSFHTDGTLLDEFDGVVGVIFGFDNADEDETMAFINKYLEKPKPTPEQAREIIINEIKRLNDDWKPNWSDELECKFYVEYHCNCEKFGITHRYSYRSLPNDLYLKSAELSSQLINTHSDIYKTMLGVESWQ